MSAQLQRLSGKRLGVLLVEPPGRTSNEYELFTAMPDVDLTIVSNRGGWNATQEIVLRTCSIPFVDTHEAWAAAPVWMRGLSRLDTTGIDVIVSLEVYSISSLQASRLAKRSALPHVVWVAESLATNPLYRFPPWSLITRRLRPRIDAYLPITPTAERHLVELGRSRARCHQIWPGVDVDDFHPAPKLQGRPVVLFIGQLRADRGADKGVMDMVNACRRLRRTTHPDLELCIVGDGHLRTVLEDIANAEGFIQMKQRVPREEIPSIIREARCLVLASKQTWKWEEQLGYALIEAMACGIPIVATRTGAIPDVVLEPDRLVEEGDVIGLATAIQTALGPEAEQLGRANRDFALDRFDLRVQAQQLRRILEAIINESRDPEHVAQEDESNRRCAE